VVFILSNDNLGRYTRELCEYVETVQRRLPLATQNRHVRKFQRIAALLMGPNLLRASAQAQELIPE
jgi:hypothetical protein